MSTVTVRDSRPEDAERILEIYAYYVTHTAISFEYDIPALSEFRARMANTMKRYPYLVVEQGGTIQGYAYAGTFVGRAAYGRSCELTIYLDHTARKRGLGRALYEALEDRLRRMGILNLYACIGYPETDDPYLTKNSAEFHAHLGFSVAGKFHKCGYKFGRWYDMIWMEKIIGEHT
ncbi:MAG TPA: GNAT family N-acetyltransferase [Lachnospiraceae bacterium]|nr:GNAT family N-acetyltransferase [Lachnospiraceae bacterium]